MLTRNRILQFFEEKPEGLISGAEMAGRLGISRASVWKHVKALQQAGLPIRSQNRSGYRFVGTPDLSLSHRSLSARLSSWATAHHSWNVTSTQNQAKQAAAQRIPEGHFWTAEIQTQGRGRLSRPWESGYGGLWLSLLLRPKLGPSDVAPLSLIAGLTLLESLTCLHPELHLKLKWPNDVLVCHGGTWKKVAGLLTEMSGEMDRTHWVVLGVGLNVNNSLSPVLAGRAVSLQQLLGKPLKRAPILESFLMHFRKSYLEFQKTGFSPFQKTYWSHYFAPEASVCLRTSQGLVRGIARGVDPRGGFIVESRRKHASDRILRQTLYEGEIRP